jgi:hypothetical protein
MVTVTAHNAYVRWFDDLHVGDAAAVDGGRGIATGTVQVIQSAAHMGESRMKACSSPPWPIRIG